MATQKKVLANVKRLLSISLRKSDGSLTKFAKTYGIKDYDDFEKFYKDLKEDFKKDRESIGFAKLIEQTKSAAGRLVPAIGEFGAFVFVLRTTGYILDDLRILKKAIHELKQSEK